MLNNTKFNEFNFLNLFQKLGKQIMSKYEVHQKYKRLIKLPKLNWWLLFFMSQLNKLSLKQ